MCESEVRK